MGKEKSKKTKATVTNLEKKEELNVLAEKEAVNENNESSVSFTNDVFMKFSLIGEDATSNLLRNFFLYSCNTLQVQNCTHKSSEFRNSS